jgi:hypothetical protein
VERDAASMSDELVNKEKVTILEGDLVGDFWLKGVINRYPGYTFQAKVYDVGSVFGIEQGRISKLQVWRGDQSVMDYDRGWDEKPARRRDRKVLQEILAGFPDRQRDKANNEPPAAEQKSRRRFAFGKTRSSGRSRDDDDYEH